MKDTEFKPGEWCRFDNSEIPAMLDLLRENGYPVYRTHNRANSDLIGPDENAIGMNIITGKFNHLNCDNPNSFMTELTRAEFLYKATRGKGVPTSAENSPVEFDPSKPFEVKNEGIDWYHGDKLLHYVGTTLEGHHVVQLSPNSAVIFEHIRNIQEFTASMLEVGKTMEVVEGRRILLTRLHNNKFIDLNDLLNGEFRLDTDDLLTIKGRRVDVELIVKEV